MELNNIHENRDEMNNLYGTHYHGTVHLLSFWELLMTLTDTGYTVHKLLV